jgi:hypothetical protein
MMDREEEAHMRGASLLSVAGQFKPIPGRHEFGDVAEGMPRPWP